MMNVFFSLNVQSLSNLGLWLNFLQSPYLTTGQGREFYSLTHSWMAAKAPQGT